MNSVNIIGRLTRDQELRKTANGRSVTNFCLAVNRANEGADFIDCVAWNQTADLACKYLSKGSQIGVTGRLQTRTYDKDGHTRKVVEVVMERMQFLGDPKKKEESAYPYQEPPQTYQQPQSYTGQPQYQQQAFPYTEGGNFGDDSIDLQSDDFPF